MTSYQIWVCRLMSISLGVLDTEKVEIRCSTPFKFCEVSKTSGTERPSLTVTWASLTTHITSTGSASSRLTFCQSWNARTCPQKSWGVIIPVTLKAHWPCPSWHGSMGCLKPIRTGSGKAAGLGSKLCGQQRPRLQKPYETRSKRKAGGNELLTQLITSRTASNSYSLIGDLGPPG